MGKIAKTIHNEEILEKLKIFKFVRKESPAFNTRSYKLKFIYESMADISSHLKSEWKKHLAREMYPDIVMNKNASLATKHEIAKIYYNLCSK